MPSRNTKKDSLKFLKKVGLPVDDSDCWWVRHPERAVFEICQMIEHTNASLGIKGKGLVWVEEIASCPTRPFLVVVETDGDYPLSAPRVILMERVSGHGEGTVFVFMQSYLNGPETSILTCRNFALIWYSDFWRCCNRVC